MHRQSVPRSFLMTALSTPNLGVTPRQRQRVGAYNMVCSMRALLRASTCHGGSQCMCYKIDTWTFFEIGSKEATSVPAAVLRDPSLVPWRPKTSEPQSHQERGHCDGLVSCDTPSHSRITSMESMWTAALPDELHRETLEFWCPESQNP